MIIYIHGFGGSGEGSKARAFREYFRSIGIPFIAPSLSYVPDLAIATLEELIRSYDHNVMLIGSSLGGYYSIYLAHKYDVRSVLLNPSIYPFDTLRRSLGDAPNFYDNSSFEWNDAHIEMLTKYRIENPSPKNFLLLLQKGDELLDYREALAYLEGAETVMDEGGNHSFEGIERYFVYISKKFAAGDQRSER